MGLLKGKERAMVGALSRLASTNPFLPERIEHERDVLGDRFTSTRTVWSVDAGLDGLNPNLAKLEHAGADLVETLRERLAQGAVPDAEERALYQDLVFYVLYARYSDAWLETWRRDSQGRPRKVAAYERFAADVEHLFGVRGFERDATHEAPFLFAYGYQTRRAFHHVFRQLYGASLPMAQLLRDAGPWGQLFPEPLFDGVFEIVQQRIVGEHCIGAVFGRSAGKTDAITDTEYVGVQIHAAQDADGVRLDLPDVALVRPNPEPHVRIAPGHLCDHTFDLGHRAHIEKATEGVMRPRERGQDDETAGHGEAITFTHEFLLNGLSPLASVNHWTAAVTCQPSREISVEERAR